mmetsp:Transcript_5634/g.9811  ORF Transcript_5634/g.9811 Transcript_5634/m.9811 type:complete len:241 (+) Transcript_5634:1360-2082(+)
MCTARCGVSTDSERCPVHVRPQIQVQVAQGQVQRVQVQLLQCLTGGALIAGVGVVAAEERAHFILQLVLVPFMAFTADGLAMGITEVSSLQEHQQLGPQDEPFQSGALWSITAHFGLPALWIMFADVDREAVVGDVGQHLKNASHTLNTSEAHHISGHHALSLHGLQTMRGLVTQHVHVADAFQLTLIHAIVVNVMGHPVGHHHCHDDSWQELNALCALHHKNHEGNGRTEDTAEHASGC